MEISPEEYQKHIEYEKKFYNPEIYRDDYTEKSNPALAYFLSSFQERVKQKVGKSVWDYTISTVNERAKKKDPDLVKILSIGSGPGGTEMNLAKKFLPNYNFDCVDVNEKMIIVGEEKAKSLGLKMKFFQQDANQLNLSANTYDVVFAHASLHHLINHEHVCDEVKKSMKNDAEFIVYDVTARNGNQMWDETKKIVDEIWSKLPSKYKYDNTQNDKKIVEFLPNRDLSVDGFECIRSQDLYPILKQNFITKIEVLGYSFARRFFESPFGENYDINNLDDKLQIDKIMKFDEEYSKSHHLKPESVFLVLKK